MASVAIEEATGWLAQGGVGGVSLLACFKDEAAALGPVLDLFIVEEPLRVFTIFSV